MPRTTKLTKQKLPRYVPPVIQKRLTDYWKYTVIYDAPERQR